MYKPEELLDHIDDTITTLVATFPSSLIILAGDFNSLDDAKVVSRTALLSVVHKPTRGMNILDRVYVNEPSYTTIRVVSSTVRSDHKAVIACSGQPILPLNKTKQRRTFRQRSPAQHAKFLEHASQLSLELDKLEDTQTNFDHMCQVMIDLLNQFYPEREITVASTDPRFVTPAVKAMLRRKNRLMRAGRVEQAGAISTRVRMIITGSNAKWLRKIDTKKNPKHAWEKVREVLRGNEKSSKLPDGLTVKDLNDHYAAISTDSNYIAPAYKHSVVDEMEFITEEDVFRMLDTLKTTATGLDSIPSWFLRLGAPVFAAPIAQLFNQSVAEGTVPRQWRTAIIKPIPKVSKPTQPGDYRPISVTSVLSRTLERAIVRKAIYPALLQPLPPAIDFDDQFAYRPTGSTTAAIIAMLHTVRTMLSANPYVRILSFDFSKAFDSVSHAPLISKLANMNIPDSVYNWINNFFSERYHCTNYAGEYSAVAEVKASVIQGSAIGPASYIVTASDLRPAIDGNRMFKFADDTYLLIPAVNCSTCTAEVKHIETWATTNNLRLNRAKSKEIVFFANGKRGKQAPIPPPCPTIERVHSLRVLGIIVNAKLTAADHVDHLLSASASLLYALRVLRSSGIAADSLNDVFRSTVLAKILYCAPAWSGMCSAADRSRLDALLKRCKRYGYCDKNLPAIADMFSAADDQLFERVNRNSNHVLEPYLPAKRECCYSLRSQSHERTLINKTTELSERDYIVRVLYKYSY